MGYTPITSGGPSARPTRLWIHVLLFVLTFASTMLAGAAWVGKDPNELTNAMYGLTYALLLMSFLSAHEFGHYIAARIHGIDTSLPYFLPMPYIPFGTFGAFIRIRQPIPSRQVLFDIGVAGPLAGMVVCLIILGIGFVTLPGAGYLYAIHPEYQVSGITTSGMYFGDALLFSGMEMLLRPQGSFMPPMNEIYHYPFLCVGWFGLFVTALNLLPLGQLDGGHVLYSLIGKRQHAVARVLWWTMFLLGMLSLLGTIRVMYEEPSPVAFVIWIQQYIFPTVDAAIHLAPDLFTIGEGWLLWAILIRFLVRIPHPPVADETPLDGRRRLIGWFAMLLLVLSLPPRTIYFVQ